jgi:glyoxylase-like metal-dependent hydrolase (beta-lactamase superfamily II)
MAGPNKNLYIWFIDIGQGDGTFIKFPDITVEGDGETMLVDFGSLQADGIFNEIIGFFDNVQNPQVNVKFGHPKQINHLVLTHPHADHYNFLPYLIEKGYGFTSIYYSGEPSEYKHAKRINGNQNLADWLQAKTRPVPGTPAIAQKIDDHRVFPEKKIGTWTTILAGGVTRAAKTKDLNDLSIVLKIQYGSTAVVLSGDATYVTEAAILQATQNSNNYLKCNVLKLGHHGSARTSTTREWVQALQPECIIVSSDRHGESPGAGLDPKGFRLPEQAAIDTVLQFLPASKQLSTDKEHTYTAYLDDDTDSKKNPYGQSRSFKSFGKPNASGGDALEQQTFPHLIELPLNYFYEVRTDQMIYTSVYKLDYDDDGQAKSDRGTTLAVVIHEDGTYEIDPWVGYVETVENINNNPKRALNYFSAAEKKAFDSNGYYLPALQQPVDDTVMANARKRTLEKAQKKVAKRKLDTPPKKQSPAKKAKKE